LPGSYWTWPCLGGWLRAHRGRELGACACVCVCVCVCGGELTRTAALDAGAAAAMATMAASPTHHPTAAQAVRTHGALKMPTSSFFSLCSGPRIVKPVYFLRCGSSGPPWPSSGKLDSDSLSRLELICMGSEVQGWVLMGVGDGLGGLCTWGVECVEHSRCVTPTCAHASVVPTPRRSPRQT